MRTREVHLISRPRQWPVHDDFRLVDVELPEPSAGDVVVRNTVMSVDPYMRNRMNDVESYIPPFALGVCLDGGAVGEVLESRHPGFAPGDVVLHDAGWREHVVLPARRLRKLDVTSVPASAYLGVLGMPGLTAYVGLTAVAHVGEGDVVFVSGAAGAVGSVAGQLAKRLGATTVIGSAGSSEKVEWLRGIGFDEVFNYRDGMGEQLGRCSPFDVYFDNVDGEHLQAALDHISPFGRVAMCGSISGYNDSVAGPDNLSHVVTKRLDLRGFIVGDHRDAASEFYRRVPGMVADGSLQYRETVVDGDRARSGRLPRPPPGEQHRQDARAVGAGRCLRARRHRHERDRHERNEKDNTVTAIQQSIAPQPPRRTSAASWRLSTDSSRATR